MDNNKDKIVSEETTRSHSNIVSMTGNVLKPSKASKGINKIESNKTLKEKIFSIYNCCGSYSCSYRCNSAYKLFD